MRSIIVILLLGMCSFLNGQSEKEDQAETMPYAEIPDYPDSYSANTVAARLIDGLGFRYYWATEGLRDEDLAYRPSKGARTTSETIDHLYGLSRVIYNTVMGLPNVRLTGELELSFEEKRNQSLLWLKKAADVLRNAEDGVLDEYKIVFQRGENTSEFPFWNLINGPIADAIWHCGQVVSFRRSSGNPFNSRASVFSGKVRN